MWNLRIVQLYFLLFLVYSVLGWILETTCKLVENKRFINRGFLIGPYCPIYGTGAILITVFLGKYSQDIPALFIMAIFVCAVLEYLTSYLMEKIFKARWWDYSNRKFNINGRVCLRTIVPFGILGVLIICFMNPFFIEILQKLPNLVMNIISFVLITIFFTDIVVSFNVISEVKRTTKKINLDFKFDSTEEITKRVKEILLKKSVLSRRLMNAYPKINAIRERIKDETEKIYDEVVNRIKKDDKND